MSELIGELVSLNTFTIGLTDVNGNYAMGIIDVSMKVYITQDIIQNMFDILQTHLLNPIRQQHNIQTIRNSIQNTFDQLGEFFGEDANVSFEPNTLYYGIDYVAEKCEGWDIDIIFSNYRDDHIVQNNDLAPLHALLI
jgi:hypothetical protein